MRERSQFCGPIGFISVAGLIYVGSDADIRPPMADSVALMGGVLPLADSLLNYGQHPCSPTECLTAQ